MTQPDRPRQLPRPDFSDAPAGRRRNLAGIKGKNTKPELMVRRMLHGMGYRYRLHQKTLPGRPDIVFPARRKVIEIRGCFWHHHADPNCRNAVLPKTRADWWAAKLAGNVDRDQRNEERLAALGWNLLVVWECEARGDAQTLAERLRTYLGPAGRPRSDPVTT